MGSAHFRGGSPPSCSSNASARSATRSPRRVRAPFATSPCRDRASSVPASVCREALGRRPRRRSASTASDHWRWKRRGRSGMPFRSIIKPGARTHVPCRSRVRGTLHPGAHRSRHRARPRFRRCPGPGHAAWKRAVNQRRRKHHAHGPAGRRRSPGVGATGAAGERCRPRRGPRAHRRPEGAGAEDLQLQSAADRHLQLRGAGPGYISIKPFLNPSVTASTRLVTSSFS